MLYDGWQPCCGEWIVVLPAFVLHIDFARTCNNWYDYDVKLCAD